MTNIPKSATGTTGLQKAFAVAIRRVFRDRLREVYAYLASNQTRIQENIRIKSALTDNDFGIIKSIMEKVKMDMSPVFSTFLSATWWKANEVTAVQMGLGQWVPFDGRVVKAVQDSAYDYMFKFITDKQEEAWETLQDGISQGDSIKTIASDIKTNFKTTAWYSELIARSETIRTYGKSTKMAIKNGGVTKEYKWLTSLKSNVCPICRPLHGRIFNIDDPNAPMPTSSTHPNCNCGIIPHVRI